MEHLVANTGIQFIIKEIEFNPSEPIQLSIGKTLKYVFCDTQNFVTNKKIFDFVLYHQSDDKYIPLSEVLEQKAADCQLNGLEVIDEAGLVHLRSDVSSIMFSTFQPGSLDVFTINSLNSFRVADPNDGNT